LQDVFRQLQATAPLSLHRPMLHTTCWCGCVPAHAEYVPTPQMVTRYSTCALGFAFSNRVLCTNVSLDLSREYCSRAPSEPFLKFLVDSLIDVASFTRSLIYGTRMRAQPCWLDAASCDDPSPPGDTLFEGDHRHGTRPVSA
jgi:hypothetical protein